jgi:GNAT superfamily N-acetyltransferase
MKLVNWIQFAWDLSTFDDVDLSLPAHYQIAPATKNDEKEVRKVFATAFLLDPTWNPAIRETMQTIQPWLDRAFASDTPTCLALRHGLRIIGAVAVSTDPNADNHLAPGPSVLVEYRNRGFGAMLLKAALKVLREAGISRALTITRANAPVTRFLYPKFGGTAVGPKPADLLAA